MEFVNNKKTPLVGCREDRKTFICHLITIDISEIPQYLVILQKENEPTLKHRQLIEKG